MAAFDGLLRETLLVAAMLCLPVLCVATLVGTAVAVFQAATQVQEQTLSLLPKLIAVGVDHRVVRRICDARMRRAVYRGPYANTGTGRLMSGTALLVFARCVGFVFRAPGFSHPSVPPAVRAGLALVLAIGLLPAMQNAHIPGGAPFVIAVATDLGIGAAIGFAASVLYDGAYAGGRALDDYVGIRGSVPGAQIFAGAGFGRIWSLVFTAGFFLLGGYRIVLAAFSRSFELVPPGAEPSARALYLYGLALPAGIIEAALLVAGPAIAIAFVGQLTLGALTRVIPRFASFTLSFPIVFAMALIATIAAVPLLFGRSAVPWLRVPFLVR